MKTIQKHTASMSSVVTMFQMASHHAYPHSERCASVRPPASTSLDALRLLDTFVASHASHADLCTLQTRHRLWLSHVLNIWGEHPKPITCEKGPSRAIEAHQLHTFLDFFQNYIGTVWHCQKTWHTEMWAVKMTVNDPKQIPFWESKFPGQLSCQNKPSWSIANCWMGVASRDCLHPLACVIVCVWFTGSRTTYYATGLQYHV